MDPSVDNIYRFPNGEEVEGLVYDAAEDGDKTCVIYNAAADMIRNGGNGITIPEGGYLKKSCDFLEKFLCVRTNCDEPLDS